MGKAQLFRQYEGFADADHRDAEDHVVADLCGLPGAVATTMDDLSGHGLKDWLAALESLLASARHDGEGACRRVAGAAGNRRVDGKMSVCGCQFMCLAGRIGVNG